MVCQFPGCEKPVAGKAYCRLHRVWLEHLGAILSVLLLALLLAAPASAFTLGVGDRPDADPTVGRQLGAKVYRLVIDPAVPLSAYDERVDAHRQAGMEPQLVVGGTGTTDHAASRGVVEAAVAAVHRWPFAYSISVVNEPDLSGIGVCEYGRLWLRAHQALAGLGVRLLFGEWSPAAGLAWHAAVLSPHHCPGTAPTLRRLVRDVAWHGYWWALNWGPRLRALTPRRDARLYVTEAGAVLRNGSAQAASPTSPREADLAGLRYWHQALRVAVRDRLMELVAWDVHSPPGASVWDSSLIDPQGRPRPAFHVVAQSHR